MDYHESHQKRRGEDLFALVALVVGIFMFWQSWLIAGFSALSSPGAFPMAASAVMVVSALIVVSGNLRRRGELSSERILPGRVVLFTALVLVYALLLAPLGFVLASFLFLALGTRLLHRASWLSCILLAACALVVIYVVFRLVFQVVLPEGILPEREIISAIGEMFGSGNGAGSEEPSQ